MSERVSINLCCYNGERYLAETLSSIAVQDYPDWELVIVNDGSTDGTDAIIQRFMSAGLPIVYHAQENQGLGASRNTALAHSSGALIAFIDQDDLWHSSKLSKQVPLFNDPTVGLVYCDAIFFNDSGQSKRYRAGDPPPTGRCFSLLLTDYRLSLPTVMIRKAAVDALSYPFDPRFNLIEEADLFRRIAYHWNLAMVPQPLAKWRVHGGSWTWRRFHRFSEETDMMLASYESLWPDFRRRHANDIAALKTQVDVDAALHAIRCGRKSDARALIAPHRHHSAKARLLFLGTLLPMPVLELLYRLKHRVTLTSPLPTVEADESPV